MTKELELWESVDSTDYNKNPFVKNILTDWADKKGLNVPISVVHRRSSIKHTRGLNPSMPIENFVGSPLIEWYEKRIRPVTDWTISEYKEKFKRKRPEWAKSFSERNIYRASVLHDKYKYQFVIPEDLSTTDSWYVERELFIPDLSKKKRVVVERVFSVGGICNKVTLIHLRGGGFANRIRVENKLFPNKWICTKGYYNSKKLEGSNCPQLIKLPNPWSAYL